MAYIQISRNHRIRSQLLPERRAHRKSVNGDPWGGQTSLFWSPLCSFLPTHKTGDMMEEATLQQIKKSKLKDPGILLHLYILSFCDINPDKLKLRTGNKQKAAVWFAPHLFPTTWILLQHGTNSIPALEIHPFLVTQGKISFSHPSVRLDLPRRAQQRPRWELRQWWALLGQECPLTTAATGRLALTVMGVI